MSALSGRFDDFEILISPDRGDGIYPVSVISSPAGQADGEFVLPLPAQELNAATEKMHAMETDAALLKEFGKRIFSALFDGDVRSRYTESVGIASGREDNGLRIRLHIRPPELATLPWELMYDPGKMEFLGLSKRALITRYIHAPRRPSPLQTNHPLRILVLIASPRDLPKLDSENEVAQIEKALAVPLEQELIQFEVLRHATPRALQKALRDDYHVLHFIGHGVFEEGMGKLVFEDRYGDAVPQSGNDLGTLLNNTPVRLVVLNACQSAQNITNAQVLAGVGPALVKAGIPAVVAMQFVVGDESACVFTEEFFEMLSRYLPVDECVTRTRQGLMVRAGVGNVDWATPVLFLRAPDGVIFLPEGVDLVKDDTPQKETGQFCELSVTPHKPISPVAELPAEKEIIRHLCTLTNFPTYKRWADPHEAMSRWVAPYRDGHPDGLFRQDVTVVVEREPVTVILGEPGMGKTAILELLIYLYAGRALRGDENALIPVFLKLSQYGGEDSLFPLIRTGLNRHGEINLSPDKNDAHTRTLLAQRRFLILIDGLNQIPGDAAEQAYGINTVKHFLEAHPQHKYVITCRRSTYEYDPEWKAWVVLPHSREDVQAYLVHRLGEARGRPLYQGLPERMRELARTPLILSVLLDELRHRGDRAANELGPLFAHFSSRMLQTERSPLPVETKKALLARLAYRMKLDQVHEYSLGDALWLMASEAEDLQLKKAAPRELLDDLISGGLLRSGSTGRVAFSHPYCQDYFASLALQGELVRVDMDWQALARKQEWREAILFLVSMAERPADLLGKLIDLDPLLAGEFVLEAEGVDGELRKRVAETLAEKQKAGAETEKAKATELLTDLQKQGWVPDAIPDHPAVDARAAEGNEVTTAATLKLSRGQLVVQKGPMEGKRIPLLDGTVCLGRSSKANIFLSDPSVSRHHAEISIDKKNIRIRDLDSTNGTYVNGHQITTWRQLQDGDEILLGNLLLVLSIDN